MDCPGMAKRYANHSCHGPNWAADGPHGGTFFVGENPHRGLFPRGGPSVPLTAFPGFGKSPEFGAQSMQSTFHSGFDAESSVA